MLPVRIADKSLKMSPNRFDATTTSKLSGRRTKFIAAASTSSDSVSISGNSAATFVNVRSQRTMPKPWALDFVIEVTRRFFPRRIANSKAWRTTRSMPRRVNTAV